MIEVTGLRKSFGEHPRPRRSCTVRGYRTVRFDFGR